MERRAIVSATVDFRNRRAVLHLSDGEVVQAPLTHTDSTAPIATATQFIGHDIALFTTTRSDPFAILLPAERNASPPEDATVVYLDQKDWRVLRDAAFAPEMLASGQRVAANRLVELAAAGTVILPMSSGHVAETSAWSDSRRYELGLTMLQRSYGWHLRHPLDVRIDELRHAFANRGRPVTRHAAPHPITLGPDDLFGSGGTSYRFDPSIPPEWTLRSDTMVRWATAASLMLDEEPTKPAEIPGWADRQAAFTKIYSEARTGERSGLLDLFFLADTRIEIERAASAVGLSQGQVGRWLDDGAARDVPLMPSLALFREVLRERHADPETRWRQSDLTDMSYLSCGVAYADHVVAERHFGHLCSKAVDRIGAGAQVHRNIEELLDVLDESAT